MSVYVVIRINQSQEDRAHTGLATSCGACSVNQSAGETKAA